MLANCYNTAMRNFNLVIREVDRHIFEQIKSGAKSVETRAATPKYLSAHIGDTLTFVCGTDQITKTITSTQHFETIEKLYNQIPLQHVLPGIKSLAEAQKIHYSFPGYQQKLQQYGIMAFTLAP
jgi:ASC-1-like (ASCH) protein